MVWSQIFPERGQAKPAAANLVAYIHADQAAQNALNDRRVDAEVRSQVVRGHRTILRETLGEPYLCGDTQDLRAQGAVG